jgi:hypothetical protein
LHQSKILPASLEKATRQSSTRALWQKAMITKTCAGSSKRLVRTSGSPHGGSIFPTRTIGLYYPKTTNDLIGGDDVHNFEPKVRLKFENLDKSIQELRRIYKVHPEWFETPKPKSDKGKNVVDYSVLS